MRTLTTFVAALIIGTALGANKLVWESLYPPPYTDVPASVIIDLSCVDKSHCYIPGGSNGVGFRVYQFNGEPNGAWTPIPSANMMLMMLSIAMGGTPSNLHGGVGGIGFIGVTQGLEYYNATSKSFAKPQMPFELAEVVQSMDTTANGTTVVALDMGTSEGVFVSRDGGKTFTLRPFVGVPTLRNCSQPQYVSMVDDDTWYVTMGTAPPPPQQLHARRPQRLGARTTLSHHEPPRRWRRSASHSIVHDPMTNKFKWHRHSLAETRRYIADRLALRKNDSCAFYASVMAKTTDGGRTYTAPMVELNDTFLFDLISCYDAEHCVATGFNADATFVYTTTDGRSFRRVLSVPSTPDVVFSLFAVAHRSRTEVWVAGGVQTQESMAGLFYFSKDGGLTWVRYPVPTPDIGTVMDISFTPDGDGFASGISEFDTSTILRYADQPYYGYFTQCQCVDASCTFLCQNATFPQGMCLPSSTGGSEIFCGDGVLNVRNYETTSCVGSFTNSTMPLNQCLKSEQGNYFKNFCGPSMVQAAGVRKVLVA